MPIDPVTGVLDSILQELTDSHGAHTILLYGSRADGSAGPDSDYDLAAFAPVSSPARIARRDHGEYLDVFIYPDSVLTEPTADHLRLRSSRILSQRGRNGEAFLALLGGIHQAGPPPLAQDEIEARKVWAHKMLSRAGRGDPEGDYRRAWLLQALLEDYFHIRGLWYEGPKRALHALEHSDPSAFRCFREALRPGASLQALGESVVEVTGRQDA